jgi:hypothetical protein
MLRHIQATPPSLTHMGVTALSTGSSAGSSIDRLFRDTFANSQLQCLLESFDTVLRYIVQKLTC